MKFPRVAKKDPIEINLAPMIDVMLVLLVFFVMSSSFSQVKKNHLQISLPEAQAKAAENLPDAVEIAISQQGAYAVNGQNIIGQNANALRYALIQAVKGRAISTIPLIITADAQTTHQSVVTAMDVAGQLGLTKLSITTVKTTGKP